jgi:hypothetical protein
VSTTIVMKNGELISLRGFESEITEAINEGRKNGELIRLERDVIPTGQMIAIDPTEVSSIKGDRW